MPRNRFLVYEEDTGRVVREARTGRAIDELGLDAGQAVVRAPDRGDVGDIYDPQADEFTPPVRETEQIVNDLEAGNITAKEALLQLLKR